MGIEHGWFSVFRFRFSVFRKKQDIASSSSPEPSLQAFDFLNNYSWENGKKQTKSTAWGY